MVDVECPWCEAQLAMDARQVEEGGTCPECLTAWRYEIDDEALALAA